MSKAKPKTPPKPRTFYVYTGVGSVPVMISDSLDAIVVNEMETPNSRYSGTVFSYTEGTVGCNMVGYMDRLIEAYLKRVATEIEK